MGTPEPEPVHLQPAASPPSLLQRLPEQLAPTELPPLKRQPPPREEQVLGNHRQIKSKPASETSKTSAAATVEEKKATEGNIPEEAATAGQKTSEEKIDATHEKAEELNSTLREIKCC